jgi:hypothetical protein
MTFTLSPKSSFSNRSPRRETAGSQPHSRARRVRGARLERQPLARYTDPRGRQREVLARQGSAGSVLVVDRDAIDHGDQRLVAHLFADEPVENAALVCSHYLREAPRDGCRCRPLTAEDTRCAPLLDHPEAALAAELAPESTEPVDRLGRVYRLEPMQGTMSIPELRWRRYPSQSLHGEPELVSLRDTVASLESYEPVLGLTLHALARHRGDIDVSTTVLRSELRRVQESPIVLNRRLREVVLAIAESRGLSMSEIASRCGRVKRDGKGNESGETSWLARRLGLLPETGRSTTTPWVHSDVLALISRRGLGIAPHEVELG